MVFFSLKSLLRIFGSPYSYVDLNRVGSLKDEHGTPDMDTDHQFDFIIIGGGTSGCVLASRLSENPSVRVLLLEAGGSGTALPFSRIPSGYTFLFPTRHVFQLRTNPQAFAGNRRLYWPRARMLGGCSSINAQMAQYGDPGDFDLWARIVGDDAWSWNNFSKYFRKFENYTPDPAQPAIDISLKGTSGPVQVGYATAMFRSSKAFVQSCINFSIPYCPDFNSSTSIGVNRMITYVDEGRQRVSSESAYLTPDVLARPNLKVVLHAVVTRIIFEVVDGELRAVGVKFAASQNGPVYEARATREVVLSAGAVHSPHILLLSGVGPAEQLQQHGITVVHHLPGVGANLTDHPSVRTTFRDKTRTAPLFVQPKNVWHSIRLLWATFQYMIFRRGPLSTNWGEAAAFVRTDDRKLFPEADFPGQLKDSTSNATSPDLELFATPLCYLDHASRGFDFHSFGINVCLLRPLSVGSLSLGSASPWDDPIIDPRYLEVQDDVDRLIRGVRLCLKLSKTEPLASMVDADFEHPELDQHLDSLSNAELEKIVKNRVETLYHPTSTCRMAPQEQNGVVDSKLRVYGIRGLRVCDASVFPSIVSGHLAGAVFAVAEKLSDIIKNDLLASDSS